MSNKPNDGGPAFPWEQSPGNQNNLGMSLRDYFAGKALQGLCANPGGPFQGNHMTGWGLVNCSYNDIVDAAISLADAMLKAREQ